MPETMTKFETRPADPADQASQKLVRAMEAEIEATYADDEGSIHSVGASPQAMTPPDGDFLVVYEGTRPIGCGGIKRLDERTCEVKRMYVLPSHRGQGLSGLLLEALERRARELGFTRSRLDTGVRQAAAKHLYERSGYVEIPDYNGNTQASYWFEKDLE
jgi:GNAT superfamily N-acetyltransferase